MSFNDSRGAFFLTLYARRRAQQRSIASTAIDAALEHGRRYHAGGTRNAYFVGRREVEQMRREGVNLADDLEGLSVITDDKTGVVVTAYWARRPRRRWRGRH